MSAFDSTNLALKGIIGIKAMSEISRATGDDSDAQLYQVNSQLNNNGTTITREL